MWKKRTKWSHSNSELNVNKNKKMIASHSLASLLLVVQDHAVKHDPLLELDDGHSLTGLARRGYPQVVEHFFIAAVEAKEGAVGAVF